MLMHYCRQSKVSGKWLFVFVVGRCTAAMSLRVAILERNVPCITPSIFGDALCPSYLRQVEAENKDDRYRENKTLQVRTDGAKGSTGLMLVV